MFKVELNKKGKIDSGDNTGFYVEIVDDKKNTGGYLIIIFDKLDKSGVVYDDWIENEHELYQYIQESNWNITWI